MMSEIPYTNVGAVRTAPLNVLCDFVIKSWVKFDPAKIVVLNEKNH